MSVTEPERIDPALVPSIDIVEAALAREEESYRFRAGSIDNRAGFLLGAAAQSGRSPSHV
jgi:hypothetical protein